MNIQNFSKQKNYLFFNNKTIFNKNSYIYKLKF